MIGAGLSLNTQPGVSNQFGFKQCGSSIADYSDIALPSNTFQGLEGGYFSSRDHLVHPPARGQGSNQGGLTLRSHDIRGTPAPVFVPQPRDQIKVNGLFSNSSRGFQQPAPHPSSRSQVGSTNNNPFRSTSFRRPSISRFPPHQGQRDKFGFLRYEFEEGDETYELQPVTSFGQPRRQGKEYITPSATDQPTIVLGLSDFSTR